MDRRDVEAKQTIEDSECDSLLEINEKQGISTEKQAIHEPDVEAGVSKDGLISEGSSPPKTLRAPLTREEALTLRIKSIDSLLTFTLCIILVHNSAIRAVSTHPQADRLHETNPKAFAFIILFSAMARLLAVPMLFFVAGFTAQFGMVMRGRSPLRFMFRRMWKTALTVFFYQACAYFAKNGRQFPPFDTPHTTPYYASKEGIDALLNGPTAYVLSVFILDCIYSLFRSINLHMAGTGQPTHLITSKTRYEVAKFSLFVFIEFWVILLGSGSSRQIIPEGSVFERWMYTVNATELYSPFLYVIAYIAGVHFVHYYKYILSTTSKESAFSPLTIFLTRVAIASINLPILCYGASFSKSMLKFYDPRERPSLVFSESLASPMYGIWVLYALMVIPEATINLFFNSPALIVAWDKFSRHAHLQVYTQMIYVIANPILFFDGVFARWVFVAWMAIGNAHYWGVGGVMVGNLSVYLWDRIRNRFQRTVSVQPLEI